MTNLIKFIQNMYKFPIESILLYEVQIRKSGRLLYFLPYRSIFCFFCLHLSLLLSIRLKHCSMPENLRSFSYTPEIIALLEKNARIGWWRIDFGRQTLVCSDYLNQMLGWEGGEMPIERFIARVNPEHQERIISELSLSVSEIGYFEYNVRINTTAGDLWFYLNMCKTTQLEDGSFVGEGYARCFSGEDAAMTSDQVSENIEQVLHWQTVASRLILDMIYGDENEKVYEQALDIVRKRYSCERACVILFDHRRQIFGEIYESKSDEFPSAPEVLLGKSMENAPWIVPRIMSGQAVFIDNTDGLPEEASLEKEFLERNGVHAFMAAPIVSNKGAWGYLAVTSSSPRLWSGIDREWLIAMSYFLSACFELNRSQNALASEGEYLKSLYMNMPLGFARLRLVYNDEKVRDFIISDANATMGLHAGIPCQKLMLARGDDIKCIFAGIDDLIEIFAEIVVDNGFVERETVNVKTGRHYRNTFYSPGDREVVVLSMDITEKVAANAALHRSEEMFRMVYQHIPVGIELYDRSGKMVGANGAACEIFGYKSLDGVLGTNLFDWPSLMSNPQAAADIRAGNDASFDFTFDFKEMDPDLTSHRSVKHLSMQCTVMRDIDGNTENYLLLVIDNTEKIRTYLDLKKFQTDFDSISGFAQVGLFTWDIPSDTLMATDQWYNNTTIKRGENLSDLVRVVHPGDYERLKDFLREVKAGEITEFDTEARIRFDGGWRWLRCMCKVGRFDAEGNAVELTGMNLDITEMKAFEQSLLDAKLKAEESDRLKSSFLASMSHEIRTPLNAIVGFSGLLAYVDNPETRDEYVDIIHRNNEQLLQLVNDILDFSIIEAGILSIIPAEINVNRMLEQVMEKHIDKVSSDVRLFFEPSGEDVKIYSDETRLQQVLSNFVGNAIKFTLRGFIQLKYELRDRDIIFSVCDTGIGMTEEQVSRVFDRFVKFDEFSPGTGLGLSVCKSVVDVLGGTVGVESKPGAGSRFWFRIPVSHTRSANKEKKVVKQDKVAVPISAARPTILVAEDSESNYVLLSVILRNDFHLLHARNGQEAVDLYKEHKPDLILMDIKMPVMGGLEATRIIRGLDNAIPIVALTAYAFDSDRKAAFDAGCTGFLSKPIMASTVKDSLRMFLDGKEPVPGI